MYLTIICLCFFCINQRNSLLFCDRKTVFESLLTCWRLYIPPHFVFLTYEQVFRTFLFVSRGTPVLQHVRNVMAHAQKPDLVFQRNGRVHLNRRGRQFSRLLAVEECGTADSNCVDRALSSSARLLATHSIRIFPLHFPSRASPRAVRFWTRYTNVNILMFSKCTAETSYGGAAVHEKPEKG